MENPQMNWNTYEISSPEIKVEALESNRPLISPPSTPFPPHLSVASSSTSRRRGSTSSVAGPKRSRPYPSTAPDYINSPVRRTKSDILNMSNDFGSWSTMRSGSSRAPRRSSDDGEHPPYNMPPYMNDYLTLSDVPPTQVTPPSSNSSSLSGAMGGDGRGSRSPPSNSMYGGHGQMTQDLTWGSQPAMSGNVGLGAMNTAYSNVASTFSPSVNALYDYTTRQTSPSGSSSSQTQAYPQAYDQFGLSRNSMGQGMPQRSGGYNTASPLSAPFSQPTELTLASCVDSSAAESEIRHLRRRVRELEMESSRARSALESLRSSVPNSAGLPTPPHSSSFQSGWRARTEARKKLFCSLNRAGNALCSWHDSRRERRAYPPRNAPPGFLNCGCTYEQALFEESLSRHGVGSYHPGETVRMDPALRNPLLKLLEQRYGYKDGDFEHDPLTEEWHESESPALWEQKVLSGQTVRRRPDCQLESRR